MDYIFSLSSKSGHIICPNCKKKTLKPYINNATGLNAGDKYGRCERINSCTYDLRPKKDKNESWQKTEIKPIEVKPIEFIDSEIVQKTFNNFKENVFFMYLVKIFGRDKAFELQSTYNIGTARNGGTIFWQQDVNGLFRTGKVFYYQKNGRRNKYFGSWFIHTKIRADFNFQQCFFGLHLTNENKAVALCESEKTAIMMSVYEPDYIWVASGGSEMINLNRLVELKRLDIVCPDNLQTEKWLQKTKLFQNRKMDYTVDAAVNSGQLDAGSDILDLYLLKNQIMETK